MATRYLAFDLGAGSGRAMLGTLAGGRLDVAQPLGVSRADAGDQQEQVEWQGDEVEQQQATA